MTVDAVCLDLDDTLVAYERSVEEVLAHAFDEAGVTPCFTADEYRAAYDEFADDAGSMNALRRTCFAHLAAEAGHDPEVGHSVAGAYQAVRDQTRVELEPGAPELLDALDLPVALVTNGAPEAQRQKLEGAGLVDAFDHVVFAGYDTPSKPDPAPFEHALDELGCDPERAIHVGNSVSADVAGAHAAGLRSVWVPADPEREPDPQPHHSFPDLHELREWLHSV
jgi:putative hydrolase of the HAD superfamily